MFIIHIAKEAMFNNHYPYLTQTGLSIGVIIVFFIFSIGVYGKLIINVVEKV